jgi:hypothetical protein
MFSKNFKHTSVGVVTMLVIMAMSGTAGSARGGGGGGGGGARSASVSGGGGARAGAVNSVGGRHFSGRDGFRHGFNNGFGYGGGYGFNQIDDSSVNPAPTGEDLDTYNEEQDERRAKLTPAAIVKTYAQKKAN